VKGIRGSDVIKVDIGVVKVCVLRLSKSRIQQPGISQTRIPSIESNLLCVVREHFTFVQEKRLVHQASLGQFAKDAIKLPHDFIAGIFCLFRSCVANALF